MSASCITALTAGGRLRWQKLQRAGEVGTPAGASDDVLKPALFQRWMVTTICGSTLPAMVRQRGRFLHGPRPSCGSKAPAFGSASIVS